MGKITKIEWTDATWNPWYGCTPVSEGCRNCYAKRNWRLLGLKPGEVRRAKDETFYAPLKWKEPKRIMVCSLSDFFHPGADSARYETLRIMNSCACHTFIIVTKHSERLVNVLYEYNGRYYGFGDSSPYIWFLATVENQEMADKRIPELLELRKYGKWPVLGVSVEPMLGEIDITDYLQPEWVDDPKRKPSRLDWVICGGESGPNARPCHPDWVRSLRDQCVAAGVPFFFKQWGDWLPLHNLLVNVPSIKGKLWYNFDPDTTVCKVGKKVAGRLLDGREWKEYPK